MPDRILLGCLRQRALPSRLPFAEFDTNLRKERQLEGIAKAKAEGVYKGRKASIDAAQVKALAFEGIGASEISRRLGIGRASVYRLMAA